ncbi:MAG: hypothetical protein EBU73_06530 [Chitinophagia bacterium]|nr:hypothetical protein [Chitinophagia bacterium]
MPNWCENNLSIYGKIEDMEKIMEVIKVGDEEFSLLETLYPTPDELMLGNVPFIPNEQMKENGKKLGFESWYDWRIAKWGCKWPESSLELGQEYRTFGNYAEIAFNFETPWGPPIDAFNKISKDYPKILFALYYEEPGMGFCGNNVWANGKCVESTESQLVSRYFDESYLYDIYIENNTDSITYINNPTGKEINFLPEISATTIKETK